METDDLTIRVLIEIRDEIRSTRDDLGRRIDETNVRLDQTNVRLDQTNVQLDRTHSRLTQSELRLATEIGGVAGTLREVHTLLTGRLDLRDRVERCERDIDALKLRVG